MNHDGQDVGAVDVDGTGLLETGRQLVRQQLPMGTSLSGASARSGGYTDAQVVLCDIGSEPGARLGPYPGLSGQFILKVQLAAGGSQAAGPRGLLPSHAGLRHGSRAAVGPERIRPRHRRRI